MRKAAVLFLALLTVACFAKPKPDPVYDEIMSWQPRSVRPSMTYRYQQAPLPQYGYTVNPYTGVTTPFTIMPQYQYGPNWGVQFNSDGSSNIILEPAPGFTVVY